MEIKVSVIIPVYKVSGFIKRCVNSLFNQTLSDVEFIFVDDASPDDSMDIVVATMEEYPHLKDKVRIVRHQVNKGLASARNTGLALANGEYIYHCDSDDWLELGALEILYNAAADNNADVAYCDYYLSFVKNERYMNNPTYTKGADLLKDGFLKGKMKYNVWNKLVRSNIYRENKINFPDGHNMGEDMTMLMVAACSERTVHVKEALYHYVKLNQNAYSNTISEKNLSDIRFNVDRVMECLSGEIGAVILDDMLKFKLSIKLPFLMSNNVQDYDRWNEWYPETSKYAIESRDFPLRIRVLQKAALNHKYWILRAHYWLVFRLIYGVVYK